MPAGVSEPCGRAGSSVGLVWDRVPHPTSLVLPQPGKPWECLAAVPGGARLCFQRCWGEAGYLGNGVGASVVASFMVGPGVSPPLPAGVCLELGHGECVQCPR